VKLPPAARSSASTVLLTAEAVANFNNLKVGTVSAEMTASALQGLQRCLLASA
jgi:hypothetical protein